MGKTDMGNDWLEDQVADEPEEGQLAIDAYQTEDEVVVLAPIAGVNPEDLEIAITDEVITIKGQRKRSGAVNPENYFVEECYWGPFSRSYLFPVAVEADNARATLKNGILSVIIPKQEKSKARIIKVQAGE